MIINIHNIHLIPLLKAKYICLPYVPSLNPLNPTAKVFCWDSEGDSIAWKSVLPGFETQKLHLLFVWHTLCNSLLCLSFFILKVEIEPISYGHRIIWVNTLNDLEQCLGHVKYPLNICIYYLFICCIISILFVTYRK